MTTTQGTFTRSCGCNGRYSGANMVVGQERRCKMTEYMPRTKHAHPKVTSVTITHVWNEEAQDYVPV